MRSWAGLLHEAVKCKTINSSLKGGGLCVAPSRHAVGAAGVGEEKDLIPHS